MRACCPLQGLQAALERLQAVLQLALALRVRRHSRQQHALALLELHRQPRDRRLHGRRRRRCCLRARLQAWRVLLQIFSSAASVHVYEGKAAQMVVSMKLAAVLVRQTRVQADDQVDTGMHLRMSTCDRRHQCSEHASAWLTADPDCLHVHRSLEHA